MSILDSIKIVSQAKLDQLTFVCGSDPTYAAFVKRIASAIENMGAQSKRKRESTKKSAGINIITLLERGCPDDRIKELVSQPHIRLALEPSSEPKCAAEQEALNERIIENARLLRATSVIIGFAWAQLTLDFEHFVIAWRSANPTISTDRKLATLLRARAGDNEYNALSSAWEKLHTGYSIGTMIQYVPIGRLLRAFPRLKFFGNLSMIIGREKRVRDYVSAPEHRDYWSILPRFATEEAHSTTLEVKIDAAETPLSRDQQDLAQVELDQEILEDARKKADAKEKQDADKGDDEPEGDDCEEDEEDDDHADADDEDFVVPDEHPAPRKPLKKRASHSPSFSEERSSDEESKGHSPSVAELTDKIASALIESPVASH